MTRTVPALLALACLLAACTAGVPLPVETDLAAALVDRRDDAPPVLPAGACWAAAVTPAVFETVTEQVVAAPERRAADGTLASPATFRTETRQAMVRDRRSVWFEVPCAERLTPDLIASLQRALKARGLYLGPITGQTSAETARAVRAWQRPRGLDSDVLSLAMARALGLLPGVF